MMPRRSLPGAFLLALLAVLPLEGQIAMPGVVRAPSARSVGQAVAPAPFGPGERADYQVKLGAFSVGDGYMEVKGITDLRGVPSYHLDMGIEGGILFAKVDDQTQSWLGVPDLVSRRFIQDIHEVRYKSYRHFEFYPEELRWERLDSEEGGELASAEPLDDISFIYFVRTLPLQVGDVYTFNRYYRESGNPVIVRVERKDRIEVPAGTFNTIVVRPIIRTRGLFGEGGEAELHFTDDHRRILVYMRSKIPVVGSITLHLRELTEGRRLTTFDPARVPVPEGTTRSGPGNGEGGT